MPIGPIGTWVTDTEPGEPEAEAGAAAPELHPDAVLQRVPDVRLTLTGADTVRVTTVAGAVVDCGPLGLRVLERFGRPTRLSEFAAERTVGAQQWVELLDAVRALVDHGVLVDVHKASPSDDPAPDRRRYWWDNPRPHIEMLDDTTRTSRYIAAIERTVQPGDVVLEIGTGTGVLAMAAARAGARHVYAMEAGAIAEAAEQVVRANDLADTVSVLRGWSTSLELPERADLLVTETLGSEPFNERILETVLDARRRLLKPGARIIPVGLTLCGVAVEVPETSYGGEVYTLEGSQRWRDAYGFDFSTLVRERWVQGLRVPMATARTWRRLTAPTPLVDVELGSITSATLAAEHRVRVDEAGRLDGGYLYFVADLGPGISLSTDPEGSDGDRHWWNTLSLRPPVHVAQGQEVRLEYGRRSRRVPPGLSVTPPPDPG